MTLTVLQVSFGTYLTNYSLSFASINLGPPVQVFELAFDKCLLIILSHLFVSTFWKSQYVLHVLL